MGYHQQENKIMENIAEKTNNPSLEQGQVNQLEELKREELVEEVREIEEGEQNLLNKIRDRLNKIFGEQKKSW